MRIFTVVRDPNLKQCKINIIKLNSVGYEPVSYLLIMTVVNISYLRLCRTRVYADFWRRTRLLSVCSWPVDVLAKNKSLPAM